MNEHGYSVSNKLFLCRIFNMFSMSLKSREQLIEDIKCLETELMKLRGRFEVIVSWIRSQYDDGK